VLCFADLARRLGRPLRLDDFPMSVPLNRENREAISHAVTSPWPTKIRNMAPRGPTRTPIGATGSRRPPMKE